MDKIERIIKKSLIEQGTLAKAIKMAKGPTQGITPSDPMAHLAVAAGKSVPALSTFSKEVQKAKGAEKYANPAYDSKSAGLKPTTDLASMNKTFGVKDGMLPTWKNQAAYNALMKLGGRPFAASKAETGNFEYLPMEEPQLRQWTEEGKQPPLGVIRGVQVAMYNHPERQVGMMVYFYENPNYMYFAYNVYGSWKYVNWSYEAAPGGEKRIWLTRGGRKEGWLTHRGTQFTGEAIFVKTSDPGLNDIMKSDYIQSLRAYTGIESLFKHNEPTIVNIFGRDVNLTALADRIQSGFDWIGIAFPPIDIINAAWYTGRGRYFEAFISIIAVIPGVGDAVALIFRPFVNLFSSAARGSKAIWKTLLTKAMERNISADVVAKLFPSCIKFIETARSTKIISQQQANDMIQWLNESKGFVIDFIKQDAAAKVLAKNKGLQKKLAKRLGYEYADNTAAVATTNIFKRMWRQATSSSLVDLVTKSFKAAGRVAFSFLTKRSTNYWKAAYTTAYKQFTKILIADPKKLALCILSFGDTAISKQLTDALVTSLIKILPTRNGKIIFREVNSRGVEIGYTIQMTPQQLRNNISRNLPKALEQLLWRSKTSYTAFVESVVAAAAKPGEVINGYWTVFWTDPLRRFVNEYSSGRLTSKFTGGVAGTVRNFTSDMFDGLKQLVTSQDFLKRIDIVYNEFQEIFERTDYGTEAGSKLNQQSVIFAIIDAGWTNTTGTPIVESIRSADAKIKSLSPSYDYVSKIDNENIMQNQLDSLNFQAVISDLPGAPGYKIAYWKKLVDARKVKYLGGNSGQWVSLVDDPNEGITAAGLKKGDVYQIDKQGRVTQVGSLQ